MKDPAVNLAALLAAIAPRCSTIVAAVGLPGVAGKAARGEVQKMLDGKTLAAGHFECLDGKLGIVIALPDPPGPPQ